MEHVQTSTYTDTNEFKQRNSRLKLRQEKQEMFSNAKLYAFEDVLWRWAPNECSSDGERCLN
ncbi:hypothetical protein WN943_014314 [Citrus x changshan-huyou]